VGNWRGNPHLVPLPAHRTGPLGCRPEMWHGQPEWWLVSLVAPRGMSPGGRNPRRPRTAGSFRQASPRLFVPAPFIRFPPAGSVDRANPFPEATARDARR
jgi:hypothetical protein